MADNGSILVTGAAGQLGAVRRAVTGLLLARGLPVRAMVRREDDRAAALRAAGAEVVIGDLLEPADVYRVVSGCRRVYFSMSVSAGYLEATVTMAAVAREGGVNALIDTRRLYGGWYDGEPDNLLPAPRTEHALEWVALAGGLEPVLRRAAALEAEGNVRLACHLVEFAVMAAPGSKTGHALRREIYQARAAQQRSSMARNMFAHAARANGEGRRDTAGPGPGGA